MLRDSQEAVTYVVCVKVVSRDHPRRVDGTCRSACGTRERYIKGGGDGSAGGQNEAVKRAVYVSVVPHDCSCRVDGESLGDRESHREVQAINCSQVAVGGPNKAVSVDVYVLIVSRDCSRRVDGHRKAYSGDYTGALWIEDDEAAALGPQEAVLAG